MTRLTKYGSNYEVPFGLDENDYYDLMYDVIDWVKGKRLTVRQAQKLLKDCTDMLLDINIEE